MTEQQWLSGADLDAMLKSLRNRASERKMRLFCVAVCRHIWDLVTDAGCRGAVEVTERFADGLATQHELETAFADTANATTAANKAAVWTADSPFRFYHATETAVCVLDAVLLFAHRSSVEAESRIHTGIVLDLFGNPSRPIALDPAWQTPTVLALAQAIYDDRAYDRLPLLADALEDAGCTDAAFLAHCRGPGPHAGGCWVIDVLLGKE